MTTARPADVSVSGPGSSAATGKARDGAARPWAAQAISDTIHSAQLRTELLGDRDFWAALAAQQSLADERGNTEWLPEAGT